MTRTKIQTITKEELQEKIEDGDDFQLVNVLSPENYNLGFIEGSLKIPVDELDEREHELDKSQEVIVYCAGYECNASRTAAEKLAAKGFNVCTYEGGIKEWKQADLPTE